MIAFCTAWNSRQPKGTAIRKRLLRLLVLCVVCIKLVFRVPLAAQAEGGDIYLIEITGVINALSASYLERVIAQAEVEDIRLIVMRVDTPGGLDSATREMIQSMLGSSVPVVVHVAPSGARAASAGMFLALASHVAAMAPDTNIGAAHPVSLGGEIDETMSAKIAQDAAALARALAVRHGRSAEWAERAVLESVSLTSAEALERGLIDLIAIDLDDLVWQLDGREVITVDGAIQLSSRTGNIVEMPMSFVERLMHVITDPNIAYLLLTLGLYALIIEFQAPGLGLPGAVGVLALLLAFVALGSLPLNWAGLLLILIGVVLLVLELVSPGFGATGIAGLVFFGLGSLILFRPFAPTSPLLPSIVVNPWLVAAITGGTGVLIALAIREGIRSQRSLKTSDHLHHLAGTVGVVTSEVNPIGTAQIASELWTVVADPSSRLPIRAGEPVEVVAREDIRLRVRRWKRTSQPHS